MEFAKWWRSRGSPVLTGLAQDLLKPGPVPLKVHISEVARAQLVALPGTTAERLANHLKAIAELADLQPILYSGDEVRMLSLHLGDFQVSYSVDTGAAQVLVSEIRPGALPGTAP